MDNNEENVVEFNQGDMKSGENVENNENEQLEGWNIDDPLSDENIQTSNAILKKSRETAMIIQNIWEGTRDMYKLTNEIMHNLWMFNKENATPRRNDVPDEEWNEFNGLSKLTQADVERIFGDKHPFAKSFTVVPDTMTLISNSLKEYVDYVKFTSTLQETDRAHRSLLELREERDMLELKAVAENEPDPEKKQAMLDSVNEYMSTKYLDYLQNPLPENDIKRLVNAFGDEKIIDYWIHRSSNKLAQMKMSPKTILEISNFETIHLPERYYKLSNMLLTYFMMRITFTDVAPNGSNNKAEVSRILAMIIALDNVIRKIGTAEQTERIKKNVMALLDQLIVPVYEKYYPDEVVPEPQTESDKEEENQ